LESLPTAIQDRNRVRAMADTINHRHRMAQLVSRASSELFTLIFFSEKGAVDQDATIVAVRSNGIRIIVPRYGLEGSIKLGEVADADAEADSIDDASSKNTLRYDENSMTITDSSKGYRFRIFEQVRVHIETKENKNRRRWLSITLADGCIESTPIRELMKHTMQIDGTSDASTPAPALDENVDDEDINKFANRITSEFLLNEQQEYTKEYEMKHAEEKSSCNNNNIVKRIKT